MENLNSQYTIWRNQFFVSFSFLTSSVSRHSFFFFIFCIWKWNKIKNVLTFTKTNDRWFFSNIFFTDIFNILFMILSLNSHPKVLQLNYDSDRFTTTIYSTCLWKTVNLCVNSKPWICFAHKYWYFIAKYLG